MDESVSEFVREAQSVGAVVHTAAESELTATLSRLLAGSNSVVVTAGLERHAEALRELGHEVSVESPCNAANGDLAGADAGVCQALAGVAASGTVLVGPGTGLEGVITTLPPHSIILVERGHIHQDVATALRACADLVATPGARLAFITGPSRTSDIELTPVIGVHGPLRLDLVIVDG